MSGTVLFRLVLVLGSLLLVPPSGYSDTGASSSSTTPPPASLIRSVPIHPELASGLIPPAVVAPDLTESEAVPESGAMVEVKTVGMSMGKLRRGAYRYPDHDLTGRFVELTTELPPMFGDGE